MNQPPAEIFDLISRIWPFFLTFVGSLAWIIRVEAKQFFIEKTIKRLEDQIERNEEAIWKAVNRLQQDLHSDIREVLSRLGKIEGQLENKNH